MISSREEANDRRSVDRETIRELSHALVIAHEEKKAKHNEAKVEKA